MKVIVVKSEIKQEENEMKKKMNCQIMECTG